MDYLTEWVERMLEPYEAMRGYQETGVLLSLRLLQSCWLLRGIPRRMWSVTYASMPKSLPDF